MKALSHVPQLIHSRNFHPHTGFNKWVAVKVAGLLSSMWFFWFCAALDLVELGALVTQPFNAVAWVTFLSQTVIQLLALPVLAVMSAIQQNASDARAEADHATLSAIHEINVAQSLILEELRTLKK